MRKRSIVRGISAAIVSHYVVLCGLLVLLGLLRPFVWSAIYGEPYQPVNGPMDPDSGEWLVSQAIGFLSWVAGGYAACRWDKLESKRSVMIVGVVFMVLMALGNAPETTELVRKAIFYFEIPSALGVGWFLFRRSEPRIIVITGNEVCK